MAARRRTKTRSKRRYRTKKRTTSGARRRTGRRGSFTTSGRKQEVKRADTINTRTDPDQAGTLILMNGLYPGTDDFNRIGRKVAWKALEFKSLILYAPPVASTSYGNEILTMYIVWDRSPNGISPAVNDIIQSVDNFGTTFNSNYGFPDWNFKQRFLILKKKEWLMPGTVSAASTSAPPTSISPQNQQQNFMFKKYIKLKGLTTEYSYTAATVGSIGTGALWCLIMGTDGISAASSAWQFSTSWRLSFTDS
ncbi:MAG: capsid protein [Wigfec virus K19_292]|nr:MAG: capsid protein [Wigfec virus K19_292]